MKAIIIAILIACSFSTIFYANAESVEELHDAAYQFMKSENFSDAIDTYSKILELQPKDEQALLNRAIAYTQVDRFDQALWDIDSFLMLNPNNKKALNGKAFILEKLDCISYKKCGPLESLRILEQMLESDPTNNELENLRNFVLTNVPSFDVEGTGGDYIVRVQYVLKDSEGLLVSVTDGVKSRVVPTKLLEEYLDGEKVFLQNLEKEIVSIEEEQYVKWRYEISGIENKRTFFGKWGMYTQMAIVDIEEQDRVAKLELASAMIPAVVTDKGDHYLIIVEILKKI